MTKEVFYELLAVQLEREKQEHEDANYQHNIRHNAGRWNWWRIDKVKWGDDTYYCSPCCKHASTNISTIRRVCGRF